MVQFGLTFHRVFLLVVDRATLLDHQDYVTLIVVT
ncbi:hypothetical protein T11_12037 [Trichinella zimbabwensis]|uniref:Uncharacterized protein n=1 Tax=Trichinella zimbabwensis TaxID=268475 RepID=A0A0V1H200_9BILA|nr:hypothetical protein T11_12037 [Trichinella zimbabwensis]